MTPTANAGQALDQSAVDLVDRLGTGSIDATAYDTAWVARAGLKRPGSIDATQPLAWLRAHQHADGSWGGSAIHWHDRVICTAAALLALLEADNPADQLATNRAIEFLRLALPRLQDDAYELVCSELLLPTLLTDLVRHGVHFEEWTGVYREERAEKLALVRRLPVFNPRNQTTHSFEFFADEVTHADLLRALAPNGSLGASPSATAYLLIHGHSPEAAAYVRSTVQTDGGVNTLSPWENFEHQYVLYQLQKAGFDITHAGASILDRLQDTMTADGLSLSHAFLAPDGDDTALAIYLLTIAGRNPSALPLRRFERDAFFTTYPEERNGSLLVNLHAIDAVRVAHDYPDRDAVLRKAVDHILALRSGDWWHDKWQISQPFIAAQAVLALLPLLHEAGLERAVRECLHRVAARLLSAQHPDGGWGIHGTSNQEETASGLQALAALSLAGFTVPPDAIHQAEQTLLRLPADRTPLWVAKCLFYPEHIVEATRLSALRLGRRALHRD